MGFYLTCTDASTAGLKTPDGEMNTKAMPGGGNGNGSLSSGSSIVTISSDGILDPDAERRKDGDNRDIRNEKWYHTILQVSVPFLIAGLGTIGAGRVLTIAKVRTLPEEDAVSWKRNSNVNHPIFSFFSFFFSILSFDRGICSRPKIEE